MKQSAEGEIGASEEVASDSAKRISDERRRLITRLTALSFSAPVILASLAKTAAATS